MASRFFAMTDSESESSDTEEEIIKEPTGISASVFALSDEEEDTKRVVRSAKEKRYEELENLIKNVRNFKKNKDMSNLLSSFEDLTRAYQKALPVVQKEENGKTPRFYVRCLVELDDFISQMWEDKAGRKNMSKNNAKGLTTIRQKFRKYAKDFETDMSTFRENPDAPDSDGERDGADDQDSGADDDDGPIGPSAFRKDPSVSKDSIPGYDKGSDSEDDDDDSIDWESGSDETSSSSDEGGDYTSLRHKFLKKTTDIPDEEGKKPRKRERPNRQIKTIGEESEEEGKWETVKRGSAMPMEKPKMFGKDDEINVVTVHKKLNEIMAARGKKGTDRKEQIELLHELMNISNENNLGPPIQVKIQFNIITSIYDYNPSVSDPMKVDFWEKVLVKIEELLEMLIANTDITIGETVSEENESLEKAPIRVRGCVLTIVERMDEEFIKLLKACDAHSNEYIIRLRDEIKVCELIDKLLAYEENAGVPSDICRIYLRKIEHLYYKYDPNAVKQVKGDHSEPTSLDEVDRLCKYIYVRDNTDRLRTRAVLCHIYHMSLHDKWYTARTSCLWPIYRTQSNIRIYQPRFSTTGQWCS